MLNTSAALIFSIVVTSIVLEEMDQVQSPKRGEARLLQPLLEQGQSGRSLSMEDVDDGGEGAVSPPPRRSPFCRGSSPSCSPDPRSVLIGAAAATKRATRRIGFLPDLLDRLQRLPHRVPAAVNGRETALFTSPTAYASSFRNTETSFPSPRSTRSAAISHPRPASPVAARGDEGAHRPLEPADRGRRRGPAPCSPAGVEEGDAAPTPCSPAAAGAEEGGTAPTPCSPAGAEEGGAAPTPCSPVPTPRDGGGGERADLARGSRFRARRPGAATEKSRRRREAVEGRRTPSIWTREAECWLGCENRSGIPLETGCGRGVEQAGPTPQTSVTPQPRPRCRWRRSEQRGGGRRRGGDEQQKGRDDGGDAAAMSALRFCGECNNMLYPREDKDTRTLLYVCQACEHQEVATDTCVYKRVLRKPGGEPKDLLKDGAIDPSWPRTRSVRCYNCRHPEAAFFQAPTTGEEGLTLYFICCNPSCGHRWKD